MRAKLIYFSFFISLCYNHLIAQKTSLTEQAIKEIYLQSMQRDRSLSYTIFKLGVQQLLAQDSTVCKDKLIIVDYSQASTKKRFYFFDLTQKRLLLKTFVAHGLNSGDVYPRKFSNIEGSFQSSLGLYHTSESYCGDHDLSVRLDGLDPRKNSNVRMRDIVIHRAAYANEAYLRQHGKLGRSLGCLAIPEAITDDMIELMSAGVGVYVYGRSY